MLVALAGIAVNAQRTAIKTTDLQKSITDMITKDYAGYVISKADKVVANNTTTFEVVISRAAKTETLVFDKDGKFLKKVALKSGSLEKQTGSPAMAHHKSGTADKPTRK